MAEFCFGPGGDIAFEATPVILIVTDIIAVGADRDKSREDLTQGLFERGMSFLQFVLRLAVEHQQHADSDANLQRKCYVGRP